MTPLKPGDALIITDIQNDFLPGGALAISGSANILSILLAYVKQFELRRLPLFFTRDWHPREPLLVSPTRGALAGSLRGGLSRILAASGLRNTSRGRHYLQGDRHR